MQAANYSAVVVRRATWPHDEAAAVRLLHSYAAFLANRPNDATSICLTDYGVERARLTTCFSEPTGVMLLAFLSSDAVGCVAVKACSDKSAACEMKRLWVEPAAQGSGLGRLLAETAIQWARDRGAAMLLLDTVPEAMPKAAALYRSLGFLPTERYNKNDVPGLQFLRLNLR